jgi:hypothetical protein
MFSRLGIGTVAVSALTAFFTIAAWASPSKTACALLNVQVVSGILGVPVKPGNGPMPKLCQWRQDAKPGESTLIADLNGPDLTLFKNTKAMASFSGQTLESVPGVGDEAFFVYKQVGRNMTDSIWFRKGNSAFSVRVWGYMQGHKVTRKEAETKEEAIALRVVQNL